MKRPSKHGDLLRVIAQIIDRLSPDEIDALLDGRAALEISERVSPPRRPRTEDKRVDTSAVVAQLREARTREEAMAILQMKNSTKALLEAVARTMDLPILRTDTVERLRQKIVEAAVGYRINSEAIQGRPRGDDGR